LRRLTDYCLGTTADDAALAGETDLIRLHREEGRPSVVATVPERSTWQKPGQAHASVATASFLCDDFYSEGDAPQSTPHKVRLFAVYDPSYPNAYEYALAADNGSGLSWNINYVPDSSAFYSLLRLMMQST
jgi:hypothetical protein